jgi:hypothetical protein
MYPNHDRRPWRGSGSGGPRPLWLNGVRELFSCQIMLSVWNQIIVLLGTLAGAVLAYALQSRTVAQQRQHEVADRTRAERLQVAASLPTALVQYRHAQVARRADQLQTGARSQRLDDEVRAARAEAWSALYRFDLLIDDAPVRDAAYQLMGRIRDLKTFQDRVSLDEAGTEVHWGIQNFVKLARSRLSFA